VASGYRDLVTSRKVVMDELSSIAIGAAVIVQVCKCITPAMTQAGAKCIFR
jgi:hypothetical protein